MGFSKAPILKIGKWRHKEVEKFVQGHKACEQTSLCLNSGNLVPELAHVVPKCWKSYYGLIYFHHHPSYMR